MNILQAIKCLNEGKKVRCTEWEGGFYIVKISDSEIKNPFKNKCLTIVSNKIKHNIFKNDDCFSYSDLIAKWEVIED